MQAGSYRVVMALARAARRAALPNLLNESGKFLRSVAFPALVAGAVLAGSQPTAAAGLSALAVGAALGYGRVKLWHMRVLYERCRGLTESPSYQAVDLEGGVRMVFWDGRLVTTAVRDVPGSAGSLPGGA